MPDTPIGFVGVGAMGRPMLARLRAAGHPTRSWVRARERAEMLRAEGFVVCSTPREVAEACDVVVGCLRGDVAVEAVYLGQGGLLEGARQGQLLVEHGTISPSLARHLAAAASAHGAGFLDVPVSGGPDGAADGRLVAMAGGVEAEVERISPIVRAYARHVAYVGPVGTGSELKLVNQLLVTCHVAAAAEATALLQRLGVPLERAAAVLAQGWGASTMLERTFERVRTGALEGDGATLSGLAAVQPLVRALCDEAGLDASVHAQAAEELTRATAAGLGDADLAALHRSAAAR
jgi:3-hydroxyisobutyrate dehydrogenase-like beta-hydroxyacid dehydrogenase